MSIFVMAIGMIALLALFPLGAFQMADAIKDDHVSACVANATSVATAWNLRHDPAFSSPGPDMFTSPPGLAAAPPNGPSYPLYVDPWGNASYLPPYKNWMAGITGGIPRTTTSFVGGVSTKALQWCTFLDDINFDINAMPAASAGSSVQRNYGYSWAWLLRRPKQSVPSLVEMWVVVYQQRPLGTNLGGDETFYTAAAALPGTNVVTLNWLSPTTPPNLRAGSWILDCSPAASGPGNARFYRVVGVNDNVGTTDLEVDFPITTTAGVPIPNRFAVLDEVVEVIYKGTNWQP